MKKLQLQNQVKAVTFVTFQKVKKLKVRAITQKKEKVKVH